MSVEILSFERYEVKVPPVYIKDKMPIYLKYAEYGVVLLHCDAKLIQLKLIRVSARESPSTEKANSSTTIVFFFFPFIGSTFWQ